ncbi:MAG: hypothetical protein H6835_12595 [Planctomycetes bacterium]|nr:hypothetical protein [Planctomycetota bacterium]
MPPETIPPETRPPGPSSTDDAPRGWRWLCLCLAAAATASGVVLEVWPWMVDDAFISLRYAQRLVEGHGLTWTDTADGVAQRVEGYSNLLWVLGTAGLAELGVDYVRAARLLGGLSSLGTLAVLTFGLRWRTAALPAVVALATTTSFAVWTVGGLETPMAMLWNAVALVALQRAHERADAPATRARWRWLGGAALALLVWTRPDGPLWAAFAGAAVLLTDPPPRASRLAGWLAAAARRLLPVALPPLAALAAQLTFRKLYYDDWVPNTGHVKAATSAQSLIAGWHYLLSGCHALRALLLPAALGAVLAVARRGAGPAAWLALLATPIWSLYVVAVGGDPLPSNRMLMPLLAPLCVLGGFGLHRLAGTGRVGAAAAVLLGVGCACLARYDGARGTDDARQQLSQWEWEGEAIGEQFVSAFGARRPLLAVDAAGGLPFFTGFPSIDMLGLCDRTIATAPPAPAEYGFFAGHSHGDGTYVLDRRPDLVLFGRAAGEPLPAWYGGLQMELDERFLRDYRLVLFETGPVALRTGPRDNLRVNARVRLAGRLGYDVTQATIDVPPWLLGSYHQQMALRVKGPDQPKPGDEDFAAWAAALEQGMAWFAAPGVIAVFDHRRDSYVAEVQRPGEHIVTLLDLPEGDYEVAVEGLAEGASASVRRVDGSNDAELVVSVPAAATLPMHVTKLTLRRR